MRQVRTRRRYRPDCEPLDARIAPADLVGAGLSAPAVIPYRPGDTVPLTWSVSNLDLDTIFGAFSVAFYLSPDAFIDPATDRFLTSEVLPPGFPGLFTFQATTSVTLPPVSDPIWQGVSFGTTYIGMVTDAFGSVFEFNEFNNQNRGLFLDSVTIPVDVGGGGSGSLPDLVGTSLKVVGTGSPYGPRGSVKLTFTVANRGQARSTGFPAPAVHLYLSRDAFIDPFEDTLIHSEALPSIAPGGKLTRTRTVRLPAAGSRVWAGSGNYTIGMVIDPMDSLAESNEGNNQDVGLNRDRVKLPVNVAAAPVPSVIDKLPKIDWRPGKLSAAVFDQLAARYAELERTSRQWDARLRGIVSFDRMTAALQAQRRTLQALAGRFKALSSGAVRSVRLGPKLVLDQKGLEAADRMILAILRDRLPDDLSSDAAGFRSVRARTLGERGGTVRTADLTIESITKLGKQFVEKVSRPTADAFRTAAKVLVPLGAAVAGVGVLANYPPAVVIGAVVAGVGIGAGFVARTLDVTTQDISRDRLRSSTPRDPAPSVDLAENRQVERALGQFRRDVAEAVGDGRSSQAELLDQSARQSVGVWNAFTGLAGIAEARADEIERRIDPPEEPPKNPPNKPPTNGGRKLRLSGRWLGQVNDRYFVNGQRFDLRGPMSLTFGPARADGTLTGSVVMTFTFQGKSSTSRGTLAGRIQKNQVFKGTLRLQNGKSLPATIEKKPNSAGIKGNFGGEVTFDLRPSA